MFGFIVFLHVLVCMLLAAIILMQSGKGGGLTENFAAAESMFGAKTNVVLVKATAVLASFFLVTCLTLAFLSSKSNKSLIKGTAAKEGSAMPQTKETTTTAKSDAATPVKEGNASLNPAPAPAADAQKIGENANQENTKTEQPKDSDSGSSGQKNPR